MHTGVSSSWVVWQVCLERYIRVLMESSLEFPIHFLKIYSKLSHIRFVHIAQMSVTAVLPLQDYLFFLDFTAGLS